MFQNVCGITGIVHLSPLGYLHSIEIQPRDRARPQKFLLDDKDLYCQATGEKC